METVVLLDNKIVPMMHTEDVSTLISDSGITRYRITAKAWDWYVDSVPEPYWYFQKGIYVERFDSLLNVQWNLSADTAYYYNERQKLWKVVGNVKGINPAGEKFETSELFWNEKEGSIYTDKFIRIERRGQIHTGYGFRSNQSMSNWYILKHSGEVDIPEENSDTTRTDSIGKKSTPKENVKLIKQ